MKKRILSLIMAGTASSLRWTTMLVVFAAATSMFGIRPLLAQQADPAEEKAEAAALAKQVQNPLANLVTVPFQVNLNSGVGQFDRTVANVNFQPVVPFPGEKWNIIVRAIISSLVFSVIVAFSFITSRIIVFNIGCDLDG